MQGHRLPGWAKRCGRWAVLLFCTGLASCTATLPRPQSGICRDAAARPWLERAARSIALRPYRPGPGYDVDLAGRAVPLPSNRVSPEALAVVSYPDPGRFSGAPSGFQELANRSFVYDDALFVLWALGNGRTDEARRVLLTLQSLQNPDGTWGFSFAIHSDGFYNAGYVRAGAVAWVAYAAASYQIRSGDQQFSPLLERALRWLLQAEAGKGLVRAGRGRWLADGRFDPSWPAEFTATEHQIDAWFALRAAATADPAMAQRLDLQGGASRIRKQMNELLWLPHQGRFAQGIAGADLDHASALDASGTWGALWALANGDRRRAEAALAHVDSHHALVVLGWPGWRPYQPGAPETWFVEGGLARALALHRLGRTDEAQKAFGPAVDLACAGGVPLVYSPVWAADFPLSPAAAPTLWFLMVGAELYGGEPLVWTEVAP